MKIEKAIIRVVAEVGSETAVRRIIDDVFGRVARIVGPGRFVSPAC